MMWNWGAGRARAYLIGSGITLAAALCFGQAARAQECQLVEIVETMTSLPAMADRCIEEAVSGLEGEACARYQARLPNGWGECAKQAMARWSLAEDQELATADLKRDVAKAWKAALGWEIDLRRQVLYWQIKSTEE